MVQTPRLAMEEAERLPLTTDTRHADSHFVTGARSEARTLPGSCQLPGHYVQLGRRSISDLHPIKSTTFKSDYSSVAGPGPGWAGSERSWWWPRGSVGCKGVAPAGTQQKEGFSST